MTKPLNRQSKSSTAVNPFTAELEQTNKAATPSKRKQKNDIPKKTMRVSVPVHDKISILHDIIFLGESDRHILEETIDLALDKLISSLDEEEKAMFNLMIKKRAEKATDKE
ncbi:hypothetical protein [Bacillus sp. FSL M8-0168]|uniref:hypothetical protein n=1 Tax=Bacillus sp. FSL M8-0168 TaxID=2921614 RepID=UPI0030FDCD81